MTRWKLILVFFVPLLLSGCGLFIAPRNEIEEVELPPVLDGWIDDMASPVRDFTGTTLQMVSMAPSQYILLLFDVSDIPVGAQILSARLSLFCVTAPPAVEENELVRIKEPWDPDTVTFPLDVIYENEFDMEGGNQGRRLEVEMGKIVQSWVNGVPNHGIALETMSPTTIEFQSTEAEDQPPLLQIRYYF